MGNSADMALGDWVETDKGLIEGASRLRLDLLSVNIRPKK